MTDESSLDIPFMKAPHVVPEPKFSAPVTPAMTFGRQFERLFPGQPCYYCGDAPNSVDHVIPRSKGGSSSLENLVAACFRCNQMKGNLTLEEFIAHMQLVLKTLQEKKVIQGGSDVLQWPLAA